MSLGPRCGKPIFTSTDGYAAAWWVAGVAALLSVAPLRRLRLTPG